MTADTNPADASASSATNEAEKIAEPTVTTSCWALPAMTFLIPSRDGSATGGDGSDSFNMVISPDQGLGHVTDFLPAEDRLTFYTEFDPENPPEITVAADENGQTTSVMIGDRETLVLDGTFTRDELEIELKETKDLALDHGPDPR